MMILLSWFVTPKMKIIDTILYNGEEDLFDLRYNILKDVVDEFVVAEAQTTFSGKPKELLFDGSKYPKARHFVIDENYPKEEVDQAQRSHNTGYGHPIWVREFL